MAVTFDAAGTGNPSATNSTGPMTWTHTLDGVARTVSVSATVVTPALMLGASASYLGAASLGTPVLAHNATAAPAVTVTSATGRRPVAFIGHPRTLSVPTQTQRYLYNHLDFQGNIIVQDAAGAASVAFGATAVGSSNWSAIGVDLIDGTGDPMLLVGLWVLKSNGGAATAYTRTATVDGLAMTSQGAYDIGVVGGGFNDGFLEVFSLAVATATPPPNTGAFFME